MTEGLRYYRSDKEEVIASYVDETEFIGVKALAVR
jgi:hypothetical protein